MARPRSTDPKNDQVLVRLTEAQKDALDAMEFVDELSGAELLRSFLVNEIARRQERDQIFVDALRVRQAARLRREGRLVHLPGANEAS